jgi:hypothetical protein
MENSQAQGNVSIETFVRGWEAFACRNLNWKEVRFMHCEHCKKPIGIAGEQDYCVHCSTNLCETCMKRPSCEESTSGEHRAWSAGTLCGELAL